jgi:predicted TIM-barrel fold metal-dependent hydrolase
MTARTFFDIHAHCSLFPMPKDLFNPLRASPQVLIRRYDALGIARGVLLPIASPEWMYAVQSNEQILEIARRHRGRFVPFCNVDPRAMGYGSDAPLGRALAHYRRQGCRGIGEVTANLPFLDPLVQNLFRAAERERLPLTFHIAPFRGQIYGLYDEPGLPGLERSLAAFGRLKFLGHSPPFWAEIAPLGTPGERNSYPKGKIDREGVVPKLLRRYPNLFGDLSASSGYNALARDEEHAVAFLTEFQDRLLFGTDICGPDTPTPLVGFLCRLRDEGRISRTVFNKIARQNARRLLGLTRATRRTSKKATRRKATRRKAR